MRRAEKTGGDGARRDQPADARSRCCFKRESSGALRAKPALVLDPYFLLVRSFVWLHLISDAAIRPAKPVLAVDEPHVRSVSGAQRRIARRLRQRRPFGRRAFFRRLMQRIASEERSDWRARAEAIGFDFHTIDGERY
jgi:hypothetical protein